VFSNLLFVKWIDKGQEKKNQLETRPKEKKLVGLALGRAKRKEKMSLNKFKNHRQGVRGKKRGKKVGKNPVESIPSPMG